MSKIISIFIMVLIGLGVLFMALDYFRVIKWGWFWTTSPIFLAVVIYVIMVILAVVLGTEI